MFALFKRLHIVEGSLFVLLFLFAQTSFVYAQSGSGACDISKLQIGSVRVDTATSDRVLLIATVGDSGSSCPGGKLRFTFEYGDDNGLIGTKVVDDVRQKSDKNFTASIPLLYSALPSSTQITVEVSVVNTAGTSRDFSSASFNTPAGNGGNPGGDPPGGGGNPTPGPTPPGSPPGPGGNPNPTPNPSPTPGGTNPGPSAGDATLQNPIRFDDLVSLFFEVMRYMLLAIGALTVAVIIYGGFQMVLSRGNETAITEAKRTLTYAIGGLLVAILSYSIVGIIQSVIGVK